MEQALLGHREGGCTLILGPVPTCLPRPAGPGDASGLASRPRQPATSRQPPACPACPALGRFQHLKIALEETQVWGSERDESGEGRQFHSQTCQGWGVVGREHPMEELVPAANGGGQGMHQQEPLPSPGLMRKVLLPSLSGDTAAPGCPACGMHPAPSRAHRPAEPIVGVMGAGRRQGGMSPAVPWVVCGESLSQPCPRSPI